MQVQTILKNFGLNDKETAVYLALIALGPSPVRTIAEKTGVNRGTTYDILKSLIDEGLVSYYHKQSHQYFAAESPEKLVTALDRRQQELEEVKGQINAHLHSLTALFQRQGGRPVVKLYEGKTGIRQILEDVLATMAGAETKRYFVYSSANLRKNVYQAMPDFSKKRVAKKISVRTIALGQGGQLVGLDERKWLPITKKDLRATYEIIYGGKVAHISVDDADNPVGVVIENPEIYETQAAIFDFNWETISEKHTD
jgi:HTH-type transcriptional regulator, sugar sensing transcriptional regulator